MTLLIGALTIGLILSLLALGVFISFRIFEFPDITADGSITLGAARRGCPARARRAPVARHRRRRSLGRGARGHAYGRHPHPLRDQQAAVGHPRDDRALLRQPARDGQEQRAAALGTHAGDAGRARRRAGSRLRRRPERVGLERRPARRRRCWSPPCSSWPVVGALLYAFFKTNLGTAMQAAGDNPQMIRALGVNVEQHDRARPGALERPRSRSSGALLAQYQGFADVQMGIGMVVWGLASIIIGEALVGVRQLGFIITGAVLGSVLFRLLVAIALRGGLNPNDLKLVTAAFVFAALILPAVLTRLGTSSRRGRATPAVAPQPGARV